MSETRSPRAYIAVDHPDERPCSWSYLGAPCVLVHAHPTPHWLEVEQTMLPDAQKATDIMRSSKGVDPDDE